MYIMGLSELIYFVGAWGRTRRPNERTAPLRCIVLPELDKLKWWGWGCRRGGLEARLRCGKRVGRRARRMAQRRVKGARR